MDEKYSAAVIKAIVKLYKDGLIYKSHRLVNWCPISQSVISDEEVNPEERNGSFGIFVTLLMAIQMKALL